MHAKSSTGTPRHVAYLKEVCKAFAFESFCVKSIELACRLWELGMRNSVEWLVVRIHYLQFSCYYTKSYSSTQKDVISPSVVRYFVFNCRVELWICQPLHLRFQLQGILLCACACCLSFSLFQILTANFSWLHILSSYISCAVVCTLYSQSRQHLPCHKLSWKRFVLNVLNVFTTKA